MNERDFVDKKRSDWARLSHLVSKADRGGTRKLTQAEIQNIGTLYRRTASDMARATSHGLNDVSFLHLKEIVVRLIRLLHLLRL